MFKFVLMFFVVTSIPVFGAIVNQRPIHQSCDYRLQAQEKAMREGRGPGEKEEREATFVTAYANGNYVMDIFSGGPDFFVRETITYTPIGNGEYHVEYDGGGSGIQTFTSRTPPVITAQVIQDRNRRNHFTSKALAKFPQLTGSELEKLVEALMVSESCYQPGTIKALFHPSSQVTRQEIRQHLEGTLLIDTESVMLEISPDYLCFINSLNYLRTHGFRDVADGVADRLKGLL